MLVKNIADEGQQTNVCSAWQVLRFLQSLRTLYMMCASLLKLKS